MTKWHVVCADILDISADGLICSANPNLNLSGGVGGALLLQYGPEMQDYLHCFLRSKGTNFVERGTVVTTPACGTPYRVVAHAVAIDAFYETNSDVIRAIYRNAFAHLTNASCKTIATACLGCGYGRCSVEGFVEAISDLVGSSIDGVGEIKFVTTNEELSVAIGAALSSSG